MRVLKFIRNVMAVIGILSLCIFLYNKVSSMMIFPMVWKEKARLSSPDRAQDFVVYEGNRGAMSSFEYACFLVRQGERADPGSCNPYEPVFVCSRVRPEARWENSSHLVIRSEAGPVSHQRPYSQQFNVAIDVQSGPPLAKQP